MIEGSNFKCPLCDSFLTESKYYEVVRISEEKKKIENELKKQLTIAKNDREKLELEKKKLAKDQIELKKKLETEFEKQKSLLIKKAQEEGIAKQKKKFETTSKILEKKVKELEIASNLKNEQIKELQKQLKEGRTPQDAGLDFENELVKELQNKFSNDRIEHHGKRGDIHHYILCEGKEIALIVYECKKTQEFNKNYIIQIKNDVIKNNANYGILVTFACDKKHPQFWVENDVLIVHPYGAPYIAEVLRKNLIQLYSTRLNDKELNERSKKLLEYIKSNKFRNSVKDNIIRTKELYDLLKREVEYHRTLWEKRTEHYNAISQQSKEIEIDSKNIIGENLGEKILEQPVMELMPLKKRRQDN